MMYKMEKEEDDSVHDSKHSHKAKITCKGCGKELKLLLSHLKRTKNACKDMYDMDTLEAEEKKVHREQKAARKRDLYQNNKKHTPEIYKCTICEKTFSSKQVMDDHIKHVHSDKQTSVKCVICDKTIQYGKHLNRHMRQVHGDQKIYKCQIMLPNGLKCIREYKRKEDLTHHQKMLHHGQTVGSSKDANT